MSREDFYGSIFFNINQRNEAVYSNEIFETRGNDLSISEEQTF